MESNLIVFTLLQLEKCIRIQDGEADNFVVEVIVG